MSNIPRDEAHMYDNQEASMVAQHKSLPDGTGAGMGRILANSISKAKFAMQRQQEFAKQHEHQQPHQTQHQQYRGRGSNTQQKKPQFGGNISQYHQGWL